MENRIPLGNSTEKTLTRVGTGLREQMSDAEGAGGPATVANGYELRRLKGKRECPQSPRRARAIKEGTTSRS